MTESNKRDRREGMMTEHEFRAVLDHQEAEDIARWRAEREANDPQEPS